MLFSLLTLAFLAVSPTNIQSEEAPVKDSAQISHSAPICYFSPPSGWEIAQLEEPSPYVQIGFIGKGSNPFRPSINLALEEIDVPLKEYLKAVKETHLLEPGTKWRDLGKFNFQAGPGRLTEISSTSPWGEIKILQALFVKDQIAYILTAAVLKEDFSKIQAALIASLQSLCLSPDLFTPLADLLQKEELEKIFSTQTSQDEEKKAQWEKLQKTVAGCTQLGPYWQFLVLKEGYAKIYSPMN